MSRYTKDLLKNYIDNNLLEVGEYTYGNPTIHHWGENSKLKIGNFCSISNKVEIFIGGEHRLDWISTYPFTVLWEEAKDIKGYPKDFDREKNKIGHDVIIGNDVWIGEGAMIMSGEKIGDGSVISARSLVYKNVKPYSVVGGNPAEFLFYRFSKETIDILLKLKWWNWTIDKIKENIKILCSNNYIELLKIEKEI